MDDAQCYEDMPCWDGRTMGDRVTGSEDGTLTYHAPDGSVVCILQAVRGEYDGGPVDPAVDCWSGPVVTVAPVETAATVAPVLPDTAMPVENAWAGDAAYVLPFVLAAACIARALRQVWGD